MQDIAALALLTSAAVLGCFGFMNLLSRKQDVTPWEKVITTVGVTALGAVGFVLERNGIVAATLLLTSS